MGNEEKLNSDSEETGYEITSFPKDFTAENRPLTKQEQILVKLRLEKEDLEHRLNEVNYSIQEIIQGN